MEKQYNPENVETRWYEFWETNGYFAADKNSDKEPYVIVIPPPNVTGVLHMGHALNDTIQDILIRNRKMRGYEALWIPGVDHAGIATQNVVEKKLATEGKSRHDMGREALLEEVWQWKDAREANIREQIKRIGCACDWNRYRFTMDDGLSKAVGEVFKSLYDKGLIYRGHYIINWCPRCLTALSDEEVDYADRDGKLYHLKYPFEDGSGSITVATTRPETMLGDTAVAVNPGDERYKGLIGKNLKLPLADRLIPIIADQHVDPEFGTGLVKVTPAHDPNDFEIGRRHELPEISVMEPDATMNDVVPAYKGLDRFAARKRVMEDLEKAGLVEKVDEHKHSVGQCYRCDTIIEPYLSDQWFVAMKKLAEPAIEAARTGKVKFHPERWTKIYYDWMENIRDWCISRQIWWGHRIPVWYNDDNGEIEVSSTRPEKEGNWRQDEDVLDTWFSSWLWPFSTLGWPGETDDLKKFYPTSVLSTAPDIIFFWVARMIMAGLEFKGEVPFRDVYLHGLVRDEKGRKMSKSVGNAVDPLDIVEEYGADAMRFTLVSIAATGTDLYLSKEKFHLGRNFANKLWNASRFVMMNFPEDFAPGEDDLKMLENLGEEDLAERWILSRLQQATTDMTAAIDSFRFNDAAQTIYEFLWHDWCDWYIELSKDSVNGDDPKKAALARVTLWHVLESSLRLLHPFMPFITEEIWQRIPHSGESIYLRPWVESNDKLIDSEAVAEMNLVQQVITAVRTIRSEMNVPPSKKASLAVIPADSKAQGILAKRQDMICSLARLDEFTFIDESGKPKASGVAVVGKNELFVPLKDLIDLDKERAKLNKEADRLRGMLNGLDKKLANQQFLANAPEEVVEKERQKRQSFGETLEKIENNIAQLS